ncbi:NADPH-dependent F420 reductase [Microbacterium sp. LWH11-1.2]|uniref:NADPH-dependent F420 reductase n=1 Tax=unclassified Microbacterium TaxID=2609290 RepID=UPI0031389DFA
MTNVTVIGTGSIGSAVASVAGKAGARVQLLGRDAVKASSVVAESGAEAGKVGDPILGDIVVLAVPYEALEELAEQYADQLDGKVVVDVTNPVDFSTFDELLVPSDSSAAAELQKRLPNARVLKAFNTNFAGTISTGLVGDVPTTVLVAGDDENATRALVDLVTAGGVEAAVIGSLKRARELEAFAFLQITLAAQEIVGWDGGFALRK